MEIGRCDQARVALPVAQRDAGLDAVDADAPFLEWLRVGALVVDTRTGRTGEVQEWPYLASSAPNRAWLRPVGGGREWTPRIADLRPRPQGPLGDLPVPRSEVLTPRVPEADSPQVTSAGTS